MNRIKWLGFWGVMLLLATAAAMADSGSWITVGDYQYQRLDNGRIAIMKYNGSDEAVTVPTTLDGLVVETIGSSAFRGCDDLTSVTLSEGIACIEDNAFFACDGLTAVNLPQSLTTLVGTPFYSCDGLTSITLPAGLSVPEINPFIGCSALTRITVAEGSTTLEIRQGMLYSRAGDTLVCCPQGLAVGRLTIPEGTKTIGPGAFMGASEISSVTLPEGVTAIGASAFRYCDGLTSISLPDSLTLLGELTFDGCSDLTSLNLPEGITEIPPFCMRSCGSLTHLELPVGVRSIGNDALEYCRRLETLVLPAGLQQIGSFAFYECDNLAQVRFLGDEQAWAAVSIGVLNDALTDAELSFGPAPRTADLDLPEDLVVIESGAFANLAAGTAVRFHDHVAEIAPDAFPAGVIFIAPADSYPAQWGAAYGYTVQET